MNTLVREPIHAYGKSKFTEAEYLRFEERSLEKHEYYKGEIFAMAGASENHNIIFVKPALKTIRTFKRQTLPSVWK